METANLAMSIKVQSTMDLKYDPKVNQENGEKFNKILESKKNEVNTRNKTLNKSNNNKKVTNKNNKLDSDKTAGENNTKEIDKKDNKEVGKTEKANNTEKSDTKTEEQKLKEVADKLGISVETLSTILQSLNMKITDIKNVDQINELVKNVFELNSNSEILKDSGLSNLVKDIKDILLKDEGETGKDKIKLEKISGEDADSNTILKAGEEKDNIDASNTKESETTNASTKEVETSQKQGKKEDSKEDEKENKNDLSKIVTQGNRENKEIKVEFNNNLENIQKPIINNEKITDINIDGKINKSVEPKEILKQVIEKAKVTLTEDKAEMVIKLKPDNLGKLTMKVVTEEGMITAKFNAESQRVKEIIEANLDDLKRSLSEQGLKLDSVEVSVGQNNSNEQQNLFRQEVAKTKTYRKNIIDKIMNEINLEKLNINDTENPYMVKESRFDYIA